ncbi:MAG: hypothetical protein JW751_31175 [Polyangiaceae bacterium]|nr:hypothetical protein [Polyangiaceae bacterium]
METPNLKAKGVLVHAALVALAGATVGCWGHPVERRLSGRWLGSAVENVDEASLPAAVGWVKGTSLEFSGRKVTVAVPAEEPRTGRYQVVSAVDRKIELRVKGEDGRTDQLALELESDRRARWSVGNGRYVILEREQ